MKLPSMTFNSTVLQMEQASSIYINQLVYDLRRQGKDVTTLSLGEAFFNLPLFDFSKLDVERSFHYTESRGLPELRTRLARHYNIRHYAQVNPNENILISAGSKVIVYMSLLAIAEPGDEVLIHEPSWLSYPEQARLIGAIPRFIPFDATPDTFKNFFSNRTRVLVICNPNNPAGRIYTSDELRRIYKNCRDRGIYLFVDEAYSEFCNARTYSSIAEIVPDLDGVIVANSISKNLGISGWRIGYAIAAKNFIDQLLKLNQHLITCAPTILQMYCAKYFEELQGITDPQLQAVVEKRHRISEMVHRYGLKSLPGTATFYFFISIGSFPGTSEEFAMKLLLENNIAVVPGSAYGKSTDRFVRISIGTESEERIEKALPKIHALTTTNTFDHGILVANLNELKRNLNS